MLPDNFDVTDHGSKELEQQAITLYRENKLFLSFNAKAKKFFCDVADFNQWENLKRELQK